MARYNGPVCRICRRHGEKLFLKGERCFSPKCGVEKRSAPPGQHGGARRRKVSERGLQLKEKQKARSIYGVLERQFRRHYQEAVRRPGATGENLLRELELRLDNVAFRLGFADARKQARQLVLNGHITLNGRKTTVPSARTRPGDQVGWHPGSRSSEYFQVITHTIESKSPPTWLELDRSAMSSRVLTLPERTEMDSHINEQAIVEYYSR